MDADIFWLKFESNWLASKRFSGSYTERTVFGHIRGSCPAGLHDPCRACARLGGCDLHPRGGLHLDFQSRVREVLSVGDPVSEEKSSRQALSRDRVKALNASRATRGKPANSFDDGKRGPLRSSPTSRT